MDTKTIDIHVRQRGFEIETITNIIVEALKISFTDVEVSTVTACNDQITITLTVSFDEERHKTDLSVRLAVENLLKNTPLHIISTETSYQYGDARRTAMYSDRHADQNRAQKR